MQIQTLATGSKGNCYVISDCGAKLIIEAGIPLDNILEGIGYDTRHTEAAVISHAHADHALSAKKLLARGIDVYAPEGVCGGKGISDRTPISTRSFAIVPFAVPHKNSDGSDCECFGFVVYAKKSGEKLLFATDCMYLPNRISGYTVLMLECNYIAAYLPEVVHNEKVERRRFESHMSLETLTEAILSADMRGVKRIMLLHPSGDRMLPENAARQITAAAGVPSEFAQAGKTVLLN